MGKSQTTIDIHRFFCTRCGEEGVPIARKMGRKRATAHLKKLYCLNCAQETNHCEISPIGLYQEKDFRRDFEQGKFRR